MTSRSRRPVSLLLIAVLLLGSSSLAQGLSHRSHQIDTADSASTLVMQHEMHGMVSMPGHNTAFTAHNTAGNEHDDCFCKDLCCLSSALGVVASLPAADFDPREPGISTGSFYKSVALEIYLPPPDQQHA